MITDIPAFGDYIPASLSPQEKAQVNILIQDISLAIASRVPIGIRYDDTARVVIPASIYLQDPTEHLKKIKNKHPKPKNTIGSIGLGSRKTIGFDALQVIDTAGANEVWKSFHIDQINHLKLMTISEIEKIFPGLNDEDYMTTPTEPPTGHVENWRYENRVYTTTRGDSLYDRLGKQGSFYQNLQSEEKSI